LIRFDLLQTVAHAVGTRHGGISTPPYDTLNLGYGTRDEEYRVVENRRRFVESLGVARSSVVAGRLSHGTQVRTFRSSDHRSLNSYVTPVRSVSDRREAFFDADAAVSDVPELFLLLTFADCVPILFADRRRGVVGAAHAGWRGTARGIAVEVVRTMRREFGSNPRDMVIGIGPSIGPCCYEVGGEVLAAFAQSGLEAVTRQSNGSTSLDLWTTNERQLLEAGVAPENIENKRLCTSCNVDDFFSHRAEHGATGRFGLLIGRG
jgi:YfiH family protein